MPSPGIKPTALGSLPIELNGPAYYEMMCQGQANRLFESGEKRKLSNLYYSLFIQESNY